MAAHRGRVNAVMMGVGAAFDFHAGVQERAPRWMRQNGLEWLHRLLSDPKRLWRRYLYTNIPFLMMAGAQWVASRVTGARPAKVPAQAAQTQAPYTADGDAAATGKSSHEATRAH